MARAAPSIAPLAVLLVAAVPAAALGESSAARLVVEQPADDFIDYLRAHVDRDDVYAYTTRSLGAAEVDAIAAVPYPPNEVLELYRREFQRLGLEHHVVPATPARPVGVFVGRIDGEEKRASAAAVADGGMTLVRLSSERKEPRFRREHPSLVERYPELGRLGGEIEREQEYLHGSAVSAVLLLESQRSAPAALAAARGELLSAGWHEATPGSSAGSVATFVKQGVSAVVSVSEGERATSILVQLRSAAEDLGDLAGSGPRR